MMKSRFSLYSLLEAKIYNTDVSVYFVRTVSQPGFDAVFENERQG